MTDFESNRMRRSISQIKVRSAISLPGRVLTNEEALKLLQQAEVTYQVNLPQYLEEIRQTNPELKLDCTDQSFTIEGSLATLDASIKFSEGMENASQNISSDSAAGFSALENQTRAMTNYILAVSAPEHCPEHLVGLEIETRKWRRI